MSHTATPPSLPREPVPRLRLPRSAGLLALATAGYFASAQLGYAIALSPEGTAVFWPGAGLLLALLLLSPPGDWPWLVAGALAGNAISDRLHGAEPVVAAVGASLNMVESVFAAYVLRRWHRAPFTMATLNEVGLVALVAAVLCNGVTAVLGGAYFTHGSRLPLAVGWLNWWAGDGLGMLVVTPLVIASVEAARRRRRPSAGEVAEALLVFIALALFGAFLLTSSPADASVLGRFPYLAFPLLMWAGVRFGPWGASTAVFVLATATLWHEAAQAGLSVGMTRNDTTDVIEVFSYLALASISSLVPAALITEQRRATHRMQESESRFRQMADFIEEAFFVFDLPSGVPVYTSPTWAHIWGRPLADAAEGRNWFDPIHPDDRAEVIKALAALRHGTTMDSLIRLVRPDGAWRWVRARVYPVRDARGVVYRAVGVAEDVTSLRQAEDRLLQAQKMDAVGRLAGGVAHDFNNLLTVVLAHCELALADLPGAGALRADLEGIQRAARSAAELTGQLLSFSRKQILQAKVTPLGPLVEQLSSMLRRLIPEHIELQTAVAPATGAARIDAGHLQQVIVNLAVNARDAMPGGGRLVIATENADLEEDLVTDANTPVPRGRYVLLTASDSGTGMDAATRARAFEPFYTTKEMGRGTGLGLATVFGFVQQSGGHITLYSEPGLGTTVKIYFPRVEEPAVAAGRDGPTAVAGGSETILIAEDSDDVRRVMRSVLTRRGYDVLSASDGEAAIAMAEATDRRIDLLVTDMVMPGMNGREVAERFARLHPRAKVLLVSGYTDDAEVLHGVRDAAIAFLEKPFTPDGLAGKVRALLDGTDA